MSKPKWARRHQKWGPAKPGFWEIWHANKDSLQKNGYSVRKNPNGQWEVRFVPVAQSSWPIFKPSAVWVPEDQKASVCFRCGHVRLIPSGDIHKDCGMCGAKVDFFSETTAPADYSF